MLGTAPAISALSFSTYITSGKQGPTEAGCTNNMFFFSLTILSLLVTTTLPGHTMALPLHGEGALEVRSILQIDDSL